MTGSSRTGTNSELFDRLGDLPGVAAELRAVPDDRFDVPVPILNACAAAAIAVRRGKRGIADAAVNALLETYRLGTVANDGGPEDDVRLWENTASGLWALGAVTADEGEWQLLRSIVAKQPVDAGYYTTWLRHGQVMSARGSSDPADDNVLNLALHALRTNPGFGMIDQSESRRERVACTFDQLALILVAGLDEGGGGFYPSYAKYPVAHVEHGVIALRKPSPMRDAVFPGDNDQLRQVLRDANEVALYQAAQYRHRSYPWAYEGFQQPHTWAFIREGHMFETWANMTL